MTFTTALTAALSLLVACEDDPAPDADVLAVIEDRLAPPPQTFTIDAATGGAIRGNSTRFTIPARAIVDNAGMPVTGPVEIALRELESVGDMVRGGRPTIDDTGALLTTSGAFVLWVSDASGQELDVKALSDLAFRNWGSDQDRLMELWRPGTGDTWTRPTPPVPAMFANNEYLFASVDFPPTPQRSIDFNRSRSNKHRGVARPNSGGAGGRGMTLKVRLDAPLAGNAAVYFLPAGEAVVASLRITPALPGFASGAGVMPVGVTGKLIVVAVAGGRYYLHHDDAFVVPPGVASGGGVPEATIDVAPTEVPEADFMAYLASL